MTYFVKDFYCSLLAAIMPFDIYFMSPMFFRNNYLVSFGYLNFDIILGYILERTKCVNRLVIFRWPVAFITILVRRATL